MDPERMEQLEKELSACQNEINTQFDDNSRKQISDYMAEKITAATKIANQQIKEASDKAYQEALEKFGDPDKIDKINKVCFFSKWDKDVEDMKRDMKRDMEKKD